MKQCLIVDDSKVVRMVARKILEGLNFEIEEAENGQVAIDACRRQMPDAILLDCEGRACSGRDPAASPYRRRRTDEAESDHTGERGKG